MSISKKTSYDLKIEIEEQLVLQNEACERNQYDEAEVVAAKIKHLRKRLAQREVFEAKEAIREEQEAIRNIYGGNIQELRSSTEAKLGQYAEDATATKEQFQNRHNDEIQKLNEHLDIKYPEVPRPNTEILNLQKMLANAVKQEDFGKSHKIQTKMNKAMELHQQEWNIQRRAIISQKVGNLKEKQRREMEALDKRILATTIEMTELAENEIKTMNQQMFNKVQDCERQGESARLSRTSTIWDKNGSPKSRGSSSMCGTVYMTLNRIDQEGEGVQPFEGADKPEEKEEEEAVSEST